MLKDAVHFRENTAETRDARPLMIPRIFRAVISNLFSQICALALNIALLPVFLSHWPTRVYGEWLALSSAAVYLSTLDIGMQMAAVNRLTEAYANGDLQEYRRVQHTALAFYVSIAFAGTLCVTACCLLLPLRHIIGITAIPEIQARICFLLLGSQIVLSIPLGVIGATYRTTGMVATGQWIANAKQLATGGITLLAVLAGKGPVTIASLQLLVLFAVMAGVLIDIWTRFPRIRLGVRCASLSCLKDLLRPSGMFSLMTLGNLLAIQGPPLIISASLGGVAVAEFVTCRSLISYGKQLGTILTNSFWTDLTRLYAVGRAIHLQIVQRIFVAFNCSVSIGFNVFVIVKGSQIIHSWSAKRITGNEWLLTALAIGALLQANWQTVSLVCLSSNRHFRVSMCTAASSAISLLLIVATLHRWGLIAIPIAMMVSEALICYHFVIKDACRAITVSYSQLAVRLWLATILATLLTWTVTSTLASLLPSAHLMTLAVIFVVGELVALLVMWYVFLTSQDRQFVSTAIFTPTTRTLPEVA